MGISEANSRSEKLGLHIAECAEQTENVSVIPVSETGDLVHNSFPKITKLGWVYIRVETADGLQKFANSLPYSVQRMVRVVPYKDNVLLYRFNGSQFKVKQSNFHQDLLPVAESYLSQMVSYIQELYKNDVFSDYFECEKPIKQVDKTRVKITENALVDQNQFSAPLSVMDMFESNNLAIDTISLLDSSDTYKYECSIKQSYHYTTGTVTVGELNITSFIGKILQSNSFNCPECKNTSVIHPKVGLDTVFICTNCYTEFTLEDQDQESLQKIQSRSFQEFKKLVSNRLSVISKNSHTDLVATVEENITDSVDYTKVELQGERTIFYVFTDESIQVLVVSGVVCITADTISPRYVKHDDPEQLMMYPCNQCARSMNETYTTEIEVTLQQPSVGTSYQLNPHSLCTQCMDMLLDDIEDIFYSEVPTEKTISELI